MHCRVSFLFGLFMCHLFKFVDFTPQKQKFRMKKMGSGYRYTHTPPKGRPIRIARIKLAFLIYVNESSCCCYYNSLNSGKSCKSMNKQTHARTQNRYCIKSFLLKFFASFDLHLLLFIYTTKLYSA